VTRLFDLFFNSSFKQLVIGILSALILIRTADCRAKISAEQVLNTMDYKTQEIISRYLRILKDIKSVFQNALKEKFSLKFRYVILFIYSCVYRLYDAIIKRRIVTHPSFGHSVISFAYFSVSFVVFDS